MLGNYARDVPLPKWLLTGIMPVAFLLLAFRCLQAGLQVYRNKDADLLRGVRDVTVELRDTPPGPGGGAT